MRGYADFTPRSKPSRPPLDITRSRVWHAICLGCFQARHGGGAKKASPTNEVWTDDGQMGALRPVWERCCFCKGPHTAYRIRLPGKYLACGHTSRRN